MRKSSHRCGQFSAAASDRGDSYDIFAINIASTMLGYVYGKGQKLSTNQDLGVKVATPIGTLFGQLLFGWLADLVGRKRMCTSFSLPNSVDLSLMPGLCRWCRVDDHHRRNFRSSGFWRGSCRQCNRCPHRMAWSGETTFLLSYKV